MSLGTCSSEAGACGSFKKQVHYGEGSNAPWSLLSVQPINSLLDDVWHLSNLDQCTCDRHVPIDSFKGFPLLTGWFLSVGERLEMVLHQIFMMKI